MKTVLLLVSHLGSSSNILFNVLNQNSRIQGFRTDRPYYNTDTLQYLTAYEHKLRNTAAIYMDELLHNFKFAAKDLYKICKFVYLIREARPSLNKIIARGYSQNAASDYYRYRLRRICEMAKRTPGAPLLTWDDMVSGRGLPLIEEYLNLKEPIKKISIGPEAPDVVEYNIAEKAQEAYERHFLYLKKFDLISA